MGAPAHARNRALAMDQTSLDGTAGQVFANPSAAPTAGPAAMTLYVLHDLSGRGARGEPGAGPALRRCRACFANMLAGLQEGLAAADAAIKVVPVECLSVCKSHLRRRFRRARQMDVCLRRPPGRYGGGAIILDGARLYAAEAETASFPWKQRPDALKERRDRAESANTARGMPVPMTSTSIEYIRDGAEIYRRSFAIIRAEARKLDAFHGGMKSGSPSASSTRAAWWTSRTISSFRSGAARAGIDALAGGRADPVRCQHGRGWRHPHPPAEGERRRDLHAS